MAQKITIEPVTRIEGHAKVTIHLDDAGKVDDAKMHVVEFRGFEKFCRRAALLARCPRSPSASAASARSAITWPAPRRSTTSVGVKPPPPARLLRELMHMGQMVQSHALSFFHLSSPDLLLGFDSDPAKRNVFGVLAAAPGCRRQGHLPAQVRAGRPSPPWAAGRSTRTAACAGGQNRALQADGSRVAAEEPAGGLRGGRRWAWRS